MDAQSLHAVEDAACAAPAEDADRLLIDRALRAFDQICVHLPDRRAQGIDPLARLRALAANPPAPRTHLYRALMGVFAAFGDRHTRLVLPPAESQRFAALPFTVAACWDQGGMTLLVTGSADPRLRRGDRLHAWNGQPIVAALDAHGTGQLGANSEARRAKAIQTLTIRPLGLLPPPEEQAVAIEVETASGARSMTVEWQVASAEELARACAAWIPPEPDFEAVTGDLRHRRIATPGGDIGWIRIASLQAPADPFLPMLAEVLDRQPRTGVVIDLRGCEEGFVQTGERMLGLFTDRPITPLGFALRSTDWMRDLANHCAALAPWREPIEAARRAGTSHTATRPLTPSPTIGPHVRPYPGPVIVLVDAHTYSTAEMFAAGVQDHRIGKVIGVAPRTGGGGGAAWSQQLIHRLSGDPLFAPDEDAASLRVAVLRCHRTGAQAGRPIEGGGVVPDAVHALTRRDLLEGEADLIERVIHECKMMQ
ncbi:hypothetical protein CA233_15525 [Sphingomonas sp. ABOLD]|uniref:Tail specific protease domain-containing protein n=1 Tax=Sphingomonas trueperi TaxID=53317 RepID=A0A7X5Y054_9SPHN|nr:MULTISPECIES: S41 family peptidase [Sphingomonas]NJB98203.1 hypothetical protein [Sphingomonas trueperi]RSV44143.1 hypothetical protein CA233_15525 [Sphingomonas sp. ABOLD]